jgi:uncharacterized protein
VTTDFATPLSDEERDELEALIELNYPDGTLGGAATCLHGFFTSVISGPQIKPTEWLDAVFGDSFVRKWKNRNHLHRAIDLIMRFNNEVASDLMTGKFGVLLEQRGEPPDDEEFGELWCRGYTVGMSLRAEEWVPAIESDAIMPYLTPIIGMAKPEQIGLDEYLGDKKRYSETLDLLPKCSLAIYKWWRERFAAGANFAGTVRRTTPKISPNAPCPCGSGKKYKRCCSPNRAT